MNSKVSGRRYSMWKKAEYGSIKLVKDDFAFEERYNYLKNWGQDLVLNQI